MFIGQMKRQVVSAASWDLMLLFENKDTMNLAENRLGVLEDAVYQRVLLSCNLMNEVDQ